jgi:hypothetical protein
MRTMRAHVHRLQRERSAVEKTPGLRLKLIGRTPCNRPGALAEPLTLLARADDVIE